MWMSSLVNQETGGLDILWLVLPILCCVLALTTGRGGGGGDRRSEPREEVESWYTAQDIGTAYKAIEAKTAEWRKEAEESKEAPRGIGERLRGALGGGRGAPEERFVVKEAVEPKLYRLDDRSGPIFFELTEVEGGGTVVKATYGSTIKTRMAKFKTELPLKIPATPIGNRCPSCGKPVLPEFVVCPYCGEKLIRE